VKDVFVECFETGSIQRGVSCVIDNWIPRRELSLSPQAHSLVEEFGGKHNKNVSMSSFGKL
jgi:hypothetical protein